MSLGLAGCLAAPSVPPSTQPQVTETPRTTPQTTVPPAVGTTTVDAVVQAAPLVPSLSSVTFVDANTGWAGGSGVILGTTDGGRRWQPEWTGRGWISSLTAVDRRHAWALVSAGDASLAANTDSLVRTTDGGGHWVTRIVGLGFRTIAFSSGVLGWAIVGGVTDTTSGPGRLERSVDGGVHWGPSALLAPADSVCFAGPSLGWATSGSGVYRTLDGGRRWERVAGGPNDAINAGWQSTVRCKGSGAWVFWTGGGAAGSEGYRVARTIDGGAHWATVLSQLDDALQALPTIDAYAGSFALSSSTSATFLGWCPACGYGTWSTTSTIDGGRTFVHEPLTGLYGRSLSDIAFADPQHGWIAGAAAGGFLLASTDAGRTWRTAYPASAPRPAVDVAFVSPLVGFGLGAAGDDRQILRTDDGGSTWRAIARLPTDPVVPDRDPVLSFFDADHGWVSIGEGLVATTDGGLTWQRVAGAPPGGVAFADPRRGCAGAFDLPAAMTTDGGASWQPTDAHDGVVACAATLVDPAWAAPASRFDPGELIRLGAVAGPRNAWAFGLLAPASGSQPEQFGIEATTDGGASWTAYRWPAPVEGQDGWVTADSLVRLSFVSPTIGWALTLFGRLFETSDGGATWRELR